MAEADVELGHMTFQSQEFSRASMMYADLELAWQLQLNEALAASAAMSDEAEGVCRKRLAMSVPGDQAAGGREEERLEEGTGDGDKACACAVQSAEILRQRQELIDHEMAVKAGQDVTMEIQRWWHDREFSRQLLDMPDDEWEDAGAHFEKPFVPSTSSCACSGDGEELGNCSQQECVLYFAKAREDPGYVGMAWAVTDASTGHVLFQQSKVLGLGVSAYSAEYTALIDGLSYSRSAGLRTIVARGDSAVVARQVTGVWRARSARQIEFLERVKEHEKELDGLTIYQVQKAKNQYAINLARQAILAHVEKIVNRSRSNPRIRK